MGESEGGIDEGDKLRWGESLELCGLPGGGGPY